MFLLYNLLLTLLAPFWAPWMIWRAYRRKEKPNWRERQGDYREAIPKKGDRPRLWVHTVSVGEFVAATPLLKRLRKEFPKHEIVVSVTTSSGHQTAREAEPGLYDYLVYLPIDVARFALSAMQRVRPDALIVLETELWLNLFWAAKTFDAKVFIANARLSDRAFPRAKKLRFFYETLFRYVDEILAQSETDAERFRELGAREVRVLGNVKFDQALETPSDREKWRAELGSHDDRPTVIVGSLRAEEFRDIVADLQPLLPQADFVIAPRHLERLPELKDALGESIPQTRRSEGGKIVPGGVLFLDTYGELAQAYAAADIAIVGGGFAKLGGQNVLQPLAQGVPTLHGRYMHNFRDVVALSEKAGASLATSLGQAESVPSLRETLQTLIDHPEKRREMGENARTLIQRHRGAAERIAAFLAQKIEPSK